MSGLLERRGETDLQESVSCGGVPCWEVVLPANNGRCQNVPFFVMVTMFTSKESVCVSISRNVFLRNGMVHLWIENRCQLDREAWAQVFEESDTVMPLLA